MFLDPQSQHFKLLLHWYIKHLVNPHKSTDQRCLDEQLLSNETCEPCLSLRLIVKEATFCLLTGLLDADYFTYLRGSTIGLLSRATFPTERAVSLFEDLTNAEAANIDDNTIARNFMNVYFPDIGRELDPDFFPYTILLSEHPYLAKLSAVYKDVVGATRHESTPLQQLVLILFACHQAGEVKDRIQFLPGLAEHMWSGAIQVGLPNLLVSLDQHINF